MTGHDYHPACCPLLRYHAEAQRLVEAGLVPKTDYTDVAHAIVIGRLRERYGCPGPGWTFSCPWHLYGATPIQLDEAAHVPLLRRRTDDGRKSPGQML